MARSIVFGLTSFALVAASSTGAYAHPEEAYERVISDAEIEAALDGWGDWHEDVEHGHVWRPYDVGPDWIPYTRGHWRTAAGDRWLWMSDFAWGRVTFHYGRWFDHRWLGWVWVPGYVYAPSWAAIRITDDWVSWAPLPPGPCYRGDRLVVIIADDAWSFGRYHRSSRIFHRVPHRPERVARWATHPRPRLHRAPPPRARRFVPGRVHHLDVPGPAPRAKSSIAAPWSSCSASPRSCRPIRTFTCSCSTAGTPRARTARWPFKRSNRPRRPSFGPSKTESRVASLDG